MTTEDQIIDDAYNKMENMDDIKKLLDGVFYTAMQGLREILIRGIDEENPNFTQLQLALQGKRAPVGAYIVLRRIMEIRYQLVRLY